MTSGSRLGSRKPDLSVTGDDHAAKREVIRAPLGGRCIHPGPVFLPSVGHPTARAPSDETEERQHQRQRDAQAAVTSDGAVSLFRRRASQDDCRGQGDEQSGRNLSLRPRSQ